MIIYIQLKGLYQVWTEFGLRPQDIRPPFQGKQAVYLCLHGRTVRDVRDVRVRPWCRTKDNVGLRLL